jgi:hypothetical protein
MAGVCWQARSRVGHFRLTKSRTPQEDDVAKGQQRSNREKKKPKQDKKKLMPAASPMASMDQRGKLGQGGAPKKRP